MKKIFFFYLFFISFFGFSQVKNKDLETLNDTIFVNLKNYSNDFVYDLRYATKNNFLKSQVYDCAECFLRVKTIKALVAANEEFKKQGFKIKLFDCYRPLAIQKKMWAIMPNANYVANPIKGSIHNKGGAVDITLVNLKNKELNMGTDFDFFGSKASHNYTNLPLDVINNRIFLKKVMENNGFSFIDSEWWHYNLKSAINDKVSDVKWKCN